MPIRNILKKTKVFITGWQGFIGKRLTYYLKQKGYKVDGCDLKEDRDFLYYAKGNDIVIHCAAFVSVTESVQNPGKYILNNINKLADLIKNNRRIIFISTGGAIYGNKLNAKEEDANLENCTNPYAVTKYVGEWLVRYYCKDYLILRLGNVIGEGQDERGEANCLTHFKEDNPIVVYGGKQTRDFISVEEVCRAIEFGIKNNIKGTYNIGSGKETKIIDLAKYMSAEREVPLKIKPKRKGEVDFVTLDISKAQKVGLL